MSSCNTQPLQDSNTGVLYTRDEKCATEWRMKPFQYTTFNNGKEICTSTVYCDNYNNFTKLLHRWNEAGALPNAASIEWKYLAA